jgi:hypothetical protein
VLNAFMLDDATLCIVKATADSHEALNLRIDPHQAVRSLALYITSTPPQSSLLLLIAQSPTSDNEEAEAMEAMMEPAGTTPHMSLARLKLDDLSFEALEAEHEVDPCDATDLLSLSTAPESAEDEDADSEPALVMRSITGDCCDVWCGPKGVACLSAPAYVSLYDLEENDEDEDEEDGESGASDEESAAAEGSGIAAEEEEEDS